MYLPQLNDAEMSTAGQVAYCRIRTRSGQKDSCAPHSLRHIFAKSLMDADISSEKVAALLRHQHHADLHHPGERDLEGAVETLNDTKLHPLDLHR